MEDRYSTCVGLLFLGVAVLGLPLAALSTNSFEATPKYLVFEWESNDSIEEAFPLLADEYAYGSISLFRDIDWFVRSKPQDELLFVYVDTSSSAYSTDAELKIYSSTLYEYDDDDGPGLSPCIAGAEVSAGSPVYLVVNEFARDDSITSYQLFQVLQSATQAEVEPNDTPFTANRLSASVLIASLGSTDPVDYFSFTAAAGELLVVIADNDPDDDGNLLQTEIELLDVNGTSVLATGDNSPANGNCMGSLTAPTTGEYYLRISDGGLGGGDTEYRFMVLVNGQRLPEISADSFESRIAIPAQTSRGWKQTPATHSSSGRTEK